MAYICMICGACVEKAILHSAFHADIKELQMNSHPPIDLEPAIGDTLSRQSK